MTRWARRLELGGLSFHGLRKGYSVSLAEAGASDAELDALMPHADRRMTAHYRRQADQAKLAAAGMAKLVAKRGRAGPAGT